MYDNSFPSAKSIPVADLDPEVPATATQWPDISSLDDAKLEQEILSLAAQIAISTCRWLDLVAEAERREFHYTYGAVSTAHWLSYRCGIGLGTAREQVRVARTIAEFPLIHDAFAAGVLSYSKVRAITRIATPSNEAILVEWARYATGAQMETIVRAFRGAREASDPALESKRMAKRSFIYYWEPDGSLTGTFCLPPEHGAALISAIREISKSLDEPDLPSVLAPSTNEDPDLIGMTPPSPKVDFEEQFHPEPPATKPDCPTDDGQFQYPGERVDSLSAPASEASSRITAIESSVNNPSTTSQDVSAETPIHWRNADDPLAARNADSLARISILAVSRLGADNLSLPLPSVVIHLNSDTNSTSGDRSSSIEDGPILSEQASRRLTCDSTISEAAEANGIQLYHGRKRRLVPLPLRRALQSRDRGCRFPGCHRRRFTHAHHLVHWADGGTTDIDNLVLLCGWHHHQLHEGGFDARVDPSTSDVVFFDRQGVQIPDSCSQLASDRTTSDRNLSNGLDCRLGDPEICVPLGGGEPFDLTLAMDLLFAAESC